MSESASATSTPTPYRVRLHDDAGHEWWADEPAEKGGQDTASTPMHMVMAALAACTNITLQIADACPVHKLLVSTIDLKTEVNA